MTPEEVAALTAFPERDLVGYGRNRPDPKWPGGAKIAVQFVIVSYFLCFLHNSSLH